MDFIYTLAPRPGRRFFIFITAFAAVLLLKLLFFSDSIYAATFIDEMGRKIEVKENPSRIVSLAPHLTEILYDLGLGDRIVGVTQYSDYPEEAKSKPRIGSYVKLNIEKIVSLSPDLVVATSDGNPKAVVDKLEELGIPVFVIKVGSIKDIYVNIRSIARVTGRDTRGEEVALALEKRINEIRKKIEGQKKLKVFFQLGANPLYTASAGTFIDDLITMAGCINIAGEETVKYPAYSMEEVLKRNPDVIFTVLMGSQRGKKVRHLWEKWTSLEAVKNDRIYRIEPDIINRPSARIADGLEAIVRKLYPHLFNDGGQAI